MKCLKCGSKKLNDDLLCLECGYNNHTNLNKGLHIDISDYNDKKPDKNHNFEKVRKSVFSVIISILIFLIFLIGSFTLYVVRVGTGNKILSELNEAKTNSSLLVIYIGNDQKIKESLSLYKEYYDFNVFEMNYHSLALINKHKLKEELDLKNINDSISIYNNKELIASKNIKSNEKLDKFLKENLVIPNNISDPRPEIAKLDEILLNENPTLIYIPFVNNDLVDEKNEVLKNLCLEYDIDYAFVSGYQFSNKQKMKYINQFGFSEIKNGLIVILENKSINKTIEENFLTTDNFVEIFENYDIIKSINDYLNYVNYDEFNEQLKTKQKSIFVIAKNDCRYCESLKYNIGNIAKQNNFKIYYVTVQDDDKIENVLNEIEYKGTLSYPFTIVVEDNKVLDYIIGDSDKQYFVEMFIKLGIIR